MLCRYGDCIRSSWSNVLELVLRLDKLDMLPPALEALLDSDVWGVPAAGPDAAAAAAAAGSPPAAGVAAAANGGAAVAADAEEAAASPAGAVGRPLRTARQRRAAGASNRRGLGGGVGVGSGFLRSVTQLIALQEPEYEAKGSPVSDWFHLLPLGWVDACIS
jgi:hypothetical protein